MFIRSKVSEVLYNLTRSNGLKSHIKLMSQKQRGQRLNIKSTLPNGINLAEANNHFQALSPTIFSDLQKYYEDDFTEVFERFKRNIHYNILNRNYLLCFPVINAYALLVPLKNYNEQNERLAHIMDWCIEIIASAYLLTDDMMDSSTMRWKVPCWYTLPDVKNTAQCDTKMMEMTTYLLLRKYFSHMPYYKSLLDLITTNCYLTALGQSLDVNMGIEYKKTRNLSDLKMDRFQAQLYYKTYFFTCRLSVYSAMYLAGVDYSKYHQKIDKLFLKMAGIQQAQNDAWDCFGSNKKYGKVGNDISQGKATWFIATAQKHANPKQLSLLQENYGKEDTECYKIVKRIYDELDLLNKYRYYKEEELVTMYHDIKDIPYDSVQEVLYQCIDIYNVRDRIVLDGEDPKDTTDLHSFTT